ncbi:hypothetical protein M413DRAFT_23087 [Hebeloma cylindrosporum]|uniref:Uncharacterized protein n=1 Tax=Hebeloma cylindrosporum TaxID=76867 RepID=A0A0C3CD67_HEBCY|nr:hypothetical protein M413DRAFT_23087 [Hebeloma cylindrosporum h7]
MAPVPPQISSPAFSSAWLNFAIKSNIGSRSTAAPLLARPNFQLLSQSLMMFAGPLNDDNARKDDFQSSAPLLLYMAGTVSLGSRHCGELGISNDLCITVIVLLPLTVRSTPSNSHTGSRVWIIWHVLWWKIPCEGCDMEWVRQFVSASQI